jgi:hypothetical protein
VTAREYAQSLFASGQGCKAIASLLRLPKSTVKAWRKRSRWKRTAPPLAQENAPPLGQWMQSMHHDSAHFITDKTSLCSVKVMAGDRWFPLDHCVRQCSRCMAHVP